MFIKICGITNLEDARNAAIFGADAIGFVFAKSPRQITPKKAKDIISKIKRDIIKVGVFVDEPPDNLESTALFCGLDAVQLHGDETPDYCAKLKAGKIIKAFRIKNEESLLYIKSYEHVFAYLLDSFSIGRHGGTGKSFDWRIAVKVKSFGKPLILSGGIGLDNAASAIETVTPYGVDISSSIEIKPGMKDTVLMKRLIDYIKVL